MTLFQRGKLVLILVLSMVIGACCQPADTGKQDTGQPAPMSPPESPVVNVNGSVPPGHTAAMAASGLDAERLLCNSQNRYGVGLKDISEVSASRLMQKLAPYLKTLKPDQEEKLTERLEDHMMWWMVRSVLIDADNHNFGAVVLKDKYWTDKNGKKHPLTIFRLGLTAVPPGEKSCLYSLLKEGHVRHVVNLYDGVMYVDDLVSGARAAAADFGASYVRTGDLDYGRWREKVRKHDEKGPAQDKAWDEAMRTVARLIKEQLLMPEGHAPRGNIVIHCGGGMHRSGMIVGILQRVMNGTPMEEIEKNYRYHVSYRDETNIGGFEQDNLEFIKRFKAEYLR